MFAPPSRAAPVSDARKTFANTAGRPAKDALSLKHSLTHDLASSGTLKAVATTGAVVSGGDKRAQLVRVLEDNLISRFGGTPATDALIRSTVASVISSGARVTPELMRELQERIAASLLKDTSIAPPSALPKAKAVLTATAGRSAAGPRSSTGAASRPGGGDGKPSITAGSAGGVPALASPMVAPPITTSGTEGAGAAAGGGREAFGAGAGAEAASPKLRQLRAQLLADPEPEKVLGMIDELGAKLAARQEREARDAKLAALRSELREAEAAKKERKAVDRTLENMWKSVVMENVADMDRRVALESAEAREREHAQRAIREKQIAEMKARRAREVAEKRAHETYQLKLAQKEEALRQEEAARILAEKRELVTRQMEENLKARDYKRAAADALKVEEQRAMEEYNMMVEAQQRAQAEAVKAVHARQDTLLAIADSKRKEAAAREVEEKERTLKEFEDARRRIRDAEVAEAEARRAAAASFRTELDAQVEEKSHRHDKEKQRERDMQAMLQARARAAEEELRALKESQHTSRAAYRSLLEQQVLAARKLEEMKKDRDRRAIAASLDALEEEPHLLAAVSSKLAERADAAARAKAVAREQEEEFRAALAAMGMAADESS